jgi:hypothetical protein
MEFTFSRIIKYRKPDTEIKIYAIADQHFTNRAVSWDIVHRDIKLIKDDPNSFWVGVGDYADWHLPSHPYFDAEAFDKNFPVNQLTKYAAYISNIIVDLYKPIAHKCLGWAYGNHDHNYFIRHNQMDIHESICEKLGVPNLRYAGWMYVYFVQDDKASLNPSVLYSIEPPKKFTSSLCVYVFHGKGAAATPGGKINSLRDIVNTVVNADLIITAHLHEQLIKPFVRISPDKKCGKPISVTTMALITGTYLRNYQPDHTGYGEKKAYPVTTLGATVARYKPLNKHMTMEIHGDNVGTKGSQ